MNTLLGKILKVVLICTIGGVFTVGVANAQINIKKLKDKAKEKLDGNTGENTRNQQSEDATKNK